MNHQHSKRGAVLATTLIILFVLLLFSAVALRINNQLQLREHQRVNQTQAELMVYTGKSYLISRLQDDLEAGQNFWIPLEYSAHPSQNHNLSFKIFSKQLGPWIDYWIQGRYLTGKKMNQHYKSYRLVQNLGEIPALTLLSPSASVSLAGNAKIIGDVAVKNGNVGKSYRYDLMSGPAAKHQGNILDSTARDLWEKIAPEFAMTSQWVREHLSQLDGQVLMDGDTCKYKMIFGRTIEIRGNSVLENCLVLGENIVIKQEQAFFESVIIGTKDLTVDVDSGNQMPSEELDAIVQTSSSTSSGEAKIPSVFYLEAKDENAMMTIKAYPDVAVFSVNGEEEQGYHMKTGEDSRLSGLLLTNGQVQLQGEIHGAVIASNLRLQKNEAQHGTTWQGFLWDATITKDSLMLKHIPAWTQMPVYLKYMRTAKTPFGFLPDSLRLP